MAAKLKWKDGELRLGGDCGWVLAALDHNPDRDQWRYVLNRVADASPWMESMEDAQQDAESEVRRLLKAAGVEVEP